MLSTRDVNQSTGQRKTLAPGNHTVTIYDLKLELGPAYTPNSYHIVLHVEGPNLGPDFDGFLKDPNNPNGPRFAGQIGKVRMDYYEFADGTTKSGAKVNRDYSMLRAIDMLSIACGVQDRVKAIDAADWDDMIRQVKNIVVGRQVSICAGAREYTGKTGYKEFQLYLVKPYQGKQPITQVGDANIITYDAANPYHLRKEKEAKTVEQFESKSSAEDDFNLF